MNIDNFNIYSKISKEKDTNQQDINAIFDLIQKFDEINNINEAKKYLSQIWNIKNSNCEFSVGTGAIAKVCETETKLRINFIIQNENITYCYKK